MKRIEQVPVQRHGGNGMPKIGGEYYARPSSFAKTLEDQGGLISWKAKMTARGLALSPDLIGRAATLEPDDSGWRDVVERACDRAGASSGADDGTSIHRATEMLDLGESLAGVPDRLVADAEAYRRVLDEAGLTPVAGEMFVANDELATAGTFDRLVTDSSGAGFVLDIKTTANTHRRGKTPAEYAGRWSGLSWSIQTYCYATSQPYCGESGYSSWADHGLPEPSQDAAYVVVIPRGSGTASLLQVDLVSGGRAAQLALQVRAFRQMNVTEIVTEVGSDA